MAASKRIIEAVQALPLKPGLRVLEIGCGPGAAARLVAEHVQPGGYVLAIDRSAKAITQARTGCHEAIEAGCMALRCCAIEDLILSPEETRFDLAFALRVGALDGRHPELEKPALAAIAAALSPRGRLFIDGGAPLRELRLSRTGARRRR